MCTVDWPASVFHKCCGYQAVTPKGFFYSSADTIASAFTSLPCLHLPIFVLGVSFGMRRADGYPSLSWSRKCSLKTNLQI